MNPETFLSKLRLSESVPEEYVSCYITVHELHLTALISEYYFDKIPTGFLTWSKKIKGYKLTGDHPMAWDRESQPALETLESTLLQPEHFKKMVSLWSQETGKGSGNLDARTENLCLIKAAGQWQL